MNERDLFREGLNLFESYLFWEAHEKWEQCWKNESNPDRKRIIKGIIQIAAAFHKIYKQNNLNGFYKIIDKCIYNLSSKDEAIKQLNNFKNEKDIDKYKNIFYFIIRDILND